MDSKPIDWVCILLKKKKKKSFQMLPSPQMSNAQDMDKASTFPT